MAKKAKMAAAKEKRRSKRMKAAKMAKWHMRSGSLSSISENIAGEMKANEEMAAASAGGSKAMARSENQYRWRKRRASEALKRNEADVISGMAKIESAIKCIRQRMKYQIIECMYRKQKWRSEIIKSENIAEERN